MKIRTEKHAYQPPARGDGTRVLVTRRWLRRLRKTQVDEWARELAPSLDLLQWHQGALDKLPPGSNAAEAQHERFRRRYLVEMTTQRPKLAELRGRARKGETLTLLCACHDPDWCHRTILAGVLRRGLPRGTK